MSVWDQFDTQKTGGDFVSFNNDGDTVTGVVTDIRTHTWDDGKTVPQVALDTEQGARTVTASQVQLIRGLASQRPEVGDRLTITYRGMAPVPGTNKTMKKFDVSVVRAAQAQTATVAPAQAAMGSVDAVGSVNLDGVPDENVAALKAAGLL